MDFERAVTLLESPDTWDRGAKALARIGNQRALLHLVKAYEMPEEADRLCLLEAMERLDPVDGSHRLYASTDPEVRLRGLHLMELFPDKAHLPLLAEAIKSSNPAIRRQAASSALCQPPCAQWERLLLSMLADDDEHLRLLAIEGLQYMDTPSVHRALLERLDCESDDIVKQRLKESLR